MGSSGVQGNIKVANRLLKLSIVGQVFFIGYRVIMPYLQHFNTSLIGLAYIVVMVWSTSVFFLDRDKMKGFFEGLIVFTLSLSVLDLIVNWGRLSLGILTSILFIIALALTALKLYSIGSIPTMDNLIKGKTNLWKSSSNSEYAVELIDVYKDYKVGNVVVKALRGMNLKVKRGEFVAIMGPSGSGKSTTLNLIGALDRPTRGKVLVDGIDISTLNDDELSELRNKKIGFIFQTFNLINRTTVLGNVIMPSIVSGLSKKERIEKAKRLLRLVGLENEMDRSPRFLSGGQQQRVAIARALMNDPSIVLADEPTGNLDTKTGNEVMEYLKKLNRELGTTVIVVTHDPDVARMADRIIYIRDGRVVGEEILRGEGE